MLTTGTKYLHKLILVAIKYPRDSFATIVAYGIRKQCCKSLNTLGNIFTKINLGYT